MPKRKPVARKVNSRRMLRHRQAWPVVPPASIDPRLSQLLAIRDDVSCSADARECAAHDIELEFPSF
jgi:hypothetical protein